MTTENGEERALAIPLHLQDFKGAALEVSGQKFIPGQVMAMVAFREDLEREVTEEIERQQKLPLPERLKLIQYDVSKPPADKPAMVGLVKRAVDMTRIPYQFWALIPSSSGIMRPYPTADGRYLKAQLDPRILIKTEIIAVHEATDKEPYAHYKVRLHFLTGQIFEGDKVKHLSDDASRRGGGQPKLSDLNNKCITQARGEAAEQAVPLLFPGIAEEAQSYAASVASTPAPVPQSGNLKNVGELLSLSYTTYGFPKTKEDKTSMLEILGVSKLEEITDYNAAWKTLQEKLGAK